MVERYADSFERDKWGGIETANWNLSRALSANGVDIVWYSAQDCPTSAGLALRARIEAVDAVLPLVESELFRTPMGAPSWLRRRTVRVWHDVSALAPRFSILGRCGAHGLEAGRVVCQAQAAAPAACAADIFFYEEPWTYCFPNRRYIPWAANHVPTCDYHDPQGPVVLLAGKIPQETLREVVDACVAHGLRLRVLFNNWSRLGQEAKAYFANLRLNGDHQFFWVYDLKRDHARIFGGASAALVLSHYHETFNFLAAEAVQLGVPVVAFARSGATRRFAARLIDDSEEFVYWLDQGGVDVLKPVPRSEWCWHDVGAAYTALLHSLRAHRTPVTLST